ncbi:MAG: Smr/MutS family protein [Acidobacteriota bacterium]
MLRPAFRDPNVFWAYVGTKFGVFMVAVIVTWPLARLIGPEAWIGLGVFGALLAAVTMAVLFGGSPKDPERRESKHPRMDNGRDALPDVVDAYLEVAAEKGFSEVRLIHGRGIGVQRDRVQKMLARHPLVSGFHDAPADRGGWGATIAYLKPRA